MPHPTWCQACMRVGLRRGSAASISYSILILLCLTRHTEGDEFSRWVLGSTAEPGLTVYLARMRYGRSITIYPTRALLFDSNRRQRRGPGPLPRFQPLCPGISHPTKHSLNLVYASAPFVYLNLTYSLYDRRISSLPHIPL